MRTVLFSLSAVVLLLVGCGGGATLNLDRRGSIEGDGPDRVTIQHILIAFDGSASSKKVTRSKTDAQLLAEDLYRRAKSGENFDDLVKEYTDDSVPGVYGMANNGVEADRNRQIYERSMMAPAFGDVSFSLGVGEVGLAWYDPNRSKFGWHVIKRIS